MVSVLVFYGTGEGQTAKVANRIIEVLVERGHFATFVEGRLGVTPPEANDGEAIE